MMKKYRIRVINPVSTGATYIFDREIDVFKLETKDGSTVAYDEDYNVLFSGPTVLTIITYVKPRTDG